MKRRLALLASAAVIGGLGWLTTSESGLQTAIGLAESATAGQLQIEQASGRLLGNMDIGQLRWQGAKQQIEATQIHLDWSPSALLHGSLDIAELSIAALHIVTTPSDTPTPAPTDLQLPLAVNAKKLAILKLSVSDGFTATDLAASLTSDGRQHQLADVHALTGGIAITARASLDGLAPMPLAASAEISGQLDERPLAMSLTANGPLERIALTAVATQGVAGTAEVALTPFADAAFASARLLLEDIDPATWQPGAPQAKLSITADVLPQGDGIIGSFGLTNHQPGPLDRQRLPLATLAGTVDWQGSTAKFATLHATLPGGSEFNGSGEWRDGALKLALAANRLDAAQLVSTLRSTRLNGQISSLLGADRQQLKLNLKDATYALLAEASHADQRIDLPQLQLSAGDARLSAKGELDLKTPRAFTAEGELQRFDPSRFAKVPAAQINANFKAGGRLDPRAVVDASFALKDSRVANQPLSGQGKLAIAWPRIPGIDIQLVSGANHLTAKGAFGQPGDTVVVDLDAQQLAPYGFDGGITGRLDLTGSAQQPKFAGQLNATKIGKPGVAHLSGLSLKADGGGEAGSALSLDLAITALETPDQPGLLRNIRLHGAGTNQAHSLTASAEVAGKNLLNLAVDGGLSSDFSLWQGRLLEAKMNSADKSRNFHLAAPAPIKLAGAGWSIGPAQFIGDPLDWQATLQAGADARQLHATLSAKGSRIGLVDGELNAAMLGAWSLDQQARWQGRLKTDIADLGWLGELIGDGWQSEGRLNGELQLAGTPAVPLSSGRFRGDNLALRLPAQGLNLARGELDLDLRDNLLHINRLGFDSLLQPMPRAIRLDARDDLAALTAKPGRLEISGEIRVDHGSAGENAFLDFKLDRLGAFQLPDQWVVVSGNGRLSLKDGTLGAVGKLAVDAGYWQLAPSGTPRLSDDVVVKRPGTEKPAASLRPKLELDVSTDLGRNFLFNGAGLSSRLAGSIRITAHGRDLPRASGTIRARSGRFEAYGQKLEIERGILSFNGLLDNPGLDVRAVRKGLSVEPGVQISGSAQRPVIKLISDPELPDAEKLAWLVLGHGPEQMGAGDATLLFSAAGGLLGNDSGNVVQQLKKTFGFDEFGLRQGNIGDTGGRQPTSRVAGGNSIDTAGTTGQQILSVGKRLTSNALVSYEQTLGRAEGIVKLTVNLTRQIAVIGRAGSDNALDIFYTLTFGRAEKKAVVEKD
ncbi:translocation/assembly module TamB domain-containing protein [Dechloromonas sp.]|uniref:translocation/assembly module TamB domain-containing protein n=1 Tax=Dechloromonas sp. TaxID=1917218 RepID=UPI00286D9052|nr:translocation/assembly module TamB domain-containing protein [Dechloromonas sp.]